MIRVGCIVLLALAMQVHGAERAQWVVDPLVPGADLPQAGSSLFDRLTVGADGRQIIPYPFERLMSSLEAAAGCDVSRPCSRAVLIPLGRSLQRIAAAPDFFRHPRVVAAFVDEGSGVLLRDRLFIGFQEKSGVIEVISYNEALGRFEFQIVRNFAPDHVPEVSYARRTVCIACHQNQGPIFSQPVWLETNANAAIAARLAEQQSAFAGVAARGSTDIAQAIDDATDRANAIALTQRLWRDGCGAGEAGRACRRAVVAASLQFALTDQRTHARSAPSFIRDVSQTLRRTAVASWPAGLALAGADIPNRDPLDLHVGLTALQTANIETRFDPLSPRPPAEILASFLEDRLVRGVADFWPRHSRAAIAKALDRQDHVRLHRSTLPCRVSGDAPREQFDCSSETGRLRGSLNGARGTIDEIAVADAGPVRHLRVETVRRQGSSATLTAHERERRIRLATGDAIERISLSWNAAGEGAALIDVRADFAAVRGALDGIDLEGDGPLTSTVIDAVTAKLEGRALQVRALPSPVAPADVYRPTAARSDSLALQLESQCGVCHRTAEITPPNFLSGDALRVDAALRSCGPRIFVRLAMRDRPASQRIKTPMPPEPPQVAAQAHDRSPADERALVELQATVGAMLRKEYGRNVTVDELLRHGYESLRPCLPSAAAGEASHVRTQS